MFPLNHTPGGPRNGGAPANITPGPQGNSTSDAQLSRSGGLDGVLGQSQLNNMQPAIKGVLDHLLNNFIQDNNQGHLAPSED